MAKVALLLSQYKRKTYTLPYKIPTQPKFLLTLGGSYANSPSNMFHQRLAIRQYLDRLL